MTVILGTNVCFGFGADGVFDLGNVTAGFFDSVMISPYWLRTLELHQELRIMSPL
jgi:hypothetical protein